MNDIVVIRDVSNRDFLEAYAEAGRVGLAGGRTLINRAIRRAQRHVDPQKQTSRWSHAFLFEGRRADGHHWVIESDLEVARKHIRLGAQENRVTKFFDEDYYTVLAVLDFGLAEEQTAALVRESLELVASRARYSLRELLGTLVALRHPRLRGRQNVLARDRSLYCSAFVHHLFAKIGVDLAPGVHEKNTTPEDISRTLVPHVTYLLERTRHDDARSRLARRLGRSDRKALR